METYIVSVNFKGMSRIIEYRVSAASIESAAFQGGLAACFEFIGTCGLTEIIEDVDILSILHVTEQRKAVFNA